MSKLTSRQREVYHLVIQGWSHRAIADHLHITPRTVKAHCVAIRQRTNSNTILEAAVKIACTSLPGYVP